MCTKHRHRNAGMSSPEWWLLLNGGVLDEILVSHERCPSSHFRLSFPECDECHGLWFRFLVFCPGQFQSHQHAPLQLAAPSSPLLSATGASGEPKVCFVLLESVWKRTTCNNGFVLFPETRSFSVSPVIEVDGIHSLTEKHLWMRYFFIQIIS